MNPKALLQIGAELLHTYKYKRLPPDKVFADYAAARKFLGAHDKRFLSEVFYHTLRHLRRIDEAILSAFTGTKVGERRFTAGFPVSDRDSGAVWRHDTAVRGVSKQRTEDRAVDTLRLGMAGIETGRIDAVAVSEELVRCWPAAPGKRPMAAATIQRLIERACEVSAAYAEPRRAVDADRAYSFPAWLWARMAAGREHEDAVQTAVALNEQAPIAVRINMLQSGAAYIRAMLQEAEVAFEQSPHAPDGLILADRAARGSLPGVKDGIIEFQDIGSQLAGIYAGAEPDMTVVDACAGAGGKTLHFATIMKNRGRIYAMDIDANRQRRIHQRTMRANATIVDLEAKYDANGEPPDTLRDIDLVVIDAPCSGTGTLRRNPGIKWSLSDPQLEKLRETQAAILDRWAPRVKSGGHLVYVTCSLLHDENAAQIDAFLKGHPEFAFDPPINFPVELSARGELMLDPAKHNTDGFYAARMKRK